MEERSMNYQKEYARLVGQTDQAITLLERDASAVREAMNLLTAALRDAEERYIRAGETERWEQIGA